MSDFETYVYINLSFKGKTPSSDLTPGQSSPDEQHVHRTTTSLVQDYTQILYPVKPESFRRRLLLDFLLSFLIETNGVCIAPSPHCHKAIHTPPSRQTGESLKYIFF